MIFTRHQRGWNVRRYGSAAPGFLMGMALMLVLAQAGCSEGGLSMDWGFGDVFSGDEASRPATGQPSAPASGTEQASSSKRAIKVPEASGTEASGEDPIGDASMSQLHQRVQAYVSRFPASDQEGATGGTPPADEREAHGRLAPEAAEAIPSTSQHTRSAADGGEEEDAVWRITPMMQEAASPGGPSGGHVIRVPEPTEGPKVSERSPSQARDRAWDVSHRPAAGSEALPAVTGQPTRVSPQWESPAAEVQLIDVRPAKGAREGDEASGDVESPANQPVAQSDTSVSGLGEYLRQLEERVAKNPHQFDDLYKLRLLYAATGQRSRAVAPVRDLNEAHAELLEAMLRVIVLGDEVLTQPSTSAMEALTAVEDLGRLLRQHSPVMIRNVAMVTRVNSFGDYVAVNPPVFEAGSPVHVFVYTEIANFRSEPTADGRLRTVLSEAVQVFDESGKVVWERRVPEFEDRTLTPRQDFFYPFEVKLPADLPAGQYALKVTVEDKLSATTDQQRLTFTIQ